MPEWLDDAWKWLVSLIFGAGAVWGATKSKMKEHTESIKRLDERDELQDQRFEAAMRIMQDRCDKEHAKCNADLCRKFTQIHERMNLSDRHQQQIMKDLSYLTGAMAQLLNRGPGSNHD